MSNEIENIYEGQNQIQKQTTTDMMISRQAQEVQAAIIIAKRFPRDENLAYNKIMKSCERKSLAEQAEYEYPRGGQKVSGPSIRLAEVLAQCWGNIDAGTIELEQKNGESEMMSYCWDLESNTRQTSVFTVKHQRDTKNGPKKLTDSRDIYEATANFGARRRRSCILGIIPKDIVEEALKKCHETLKKGNTEPLSDRVRKMINIFQEEFSVTKEMIEKNVGCKSDAFTENDVLKLGRVYRSLKDGMAKREDYFDIPAPANKEPVEKAPTKFEKSDKPSKKADKPEQEQISYEGTPFDTEGDK